MTKNVAGVIFPYRRRRCKQSQISVTGDNLNLAAAAACPCVPRRWLEILIENFHLVSLREDEGSRIIQLVLVGQVQVLQTGLTRLQGVDSQPSE